MKIPEGTITNALPTIAKIAGSRGWIDPIEMGLIVGFQMKLVGIDYRTDNELAGIMTILTQQGFLEMRPANGSFLTRVNPAYTGQTTFSGGPSTPMLTQDAGTITRVQ